jgi:predicted Zn-dependent protease
MAFSTGRPEWIDNTYVRAASDRIRADPKDLDALETVGAWFLAHDRAEKALECFDRITRAEPTYPGIWAMKARAFESLGDVMNAEFCRRRASERRV